MKWFHNAHVARTLAIMVELLIHGSFAAGAFLLGGFLGQLIFHDIAGPGVSELIGAWGLAAIVFFGAMQAFVYGEYNREDITAYEDEKGDGSYHQSWRELKWIVAGIELSSLAFRCYQTPSIVAKAITFVIGILALRYAYALAKVIHATANRPVEGDVYRAQQEAGRSVVGDFMKWVGRMTTEQKRRFYNGDATTIDEVRDASDRDRQQDDERRRKTEAEKQKARNLTSQLLSPSAQYPSLPEPQNPFDRSRRA